MRILAAAKMRWLYVLRLLVLALAGTQSAVASAAPLDIVAAEPTSKALRAQTAFDSYYGQAERWREAARLVKEVLQSDPNNATALVVQARMEIAWARRTQGDAFQTHRSKAYALNERALAADPTHAEALRIAGRMRHLDKDYTGARRYFDRAVDAHGVWPALAYNYGLLLWSQADYGSARTRPDDVLFTQAQQWFARALQQPDVSDTGDTSNRNAMSGAAYQLAYIAHQRGDTQRATELLESAVAHAHPTDGYRAADAARLYLTLGDYARAEQLAQAALNSLEFDHAKQVLATARVMLAWKSYMTGDKQAGARWMDRAMGVKTSKQKVQRRLQSGTAEMREAALVYAWRFRIWTYIEQADMLVDKLLGRQLFEEDELIRI
jgi:tetratricopeptide (TPR) repeat protein